MFVLKKNFEDIRLKKTLLASVVGAMFLPHAAFGQTTITGSNLDLAQSPPGTTQSYVAPNLLLSLDDSGSMRGNNMNTLKSALVSVFEDTTLLPDGKIRLAWQSMFNCTQPQGLRIDYLSADAASNPNDLDNTMRRLSGAHRANFLRYANSMIDCGWTPTHHMSRRAHHYMAAPIHINGPWADNPGEALVDDPSGQRTKPLGCRRNYHILLTDGEWNEVYFDDITIGNADGQAKILPDGKPYDPNSRDGRLYGDNDKGLIGRGAPYGTPAETTVADWAFYSWSESLQDTQNLDGTLSLAEYDAAHDDVEITNRYTGETFKFEKYWNPGNNPASWPHMVTYTIGFGAAAIPKYSYTKSGARMSMNLPSEDIPFGADGDLAEYALGTRTWRAWSHPQLDMWHAALNGRGRFYAVRKNEDLKTAFRSIIQDINKKVEPIKGSSVASGSNASRTDVNIYTSSFDAQKGWQGTIEAKTLNTGGGGSTPLWGGEGTANKLDAISDVNTRVILSSKMNTGPNDRVGVPFRWNTLGPIEQSRIGSSSMNPVAYSGIYIVDYVRGDRTKEGGSDTQPFRERTSRHGDIVNSNTWYVAAPSNIDYFTQEGYVDFVNRYRQREPMLYVGANDGMLHGFSAKDDGAERIAYVPHGVQQELKRLTEPAFDSKHRYFVDGSPMTGDIKDGNDWKTILVGSLGAGGKGYFVLDVTDPQNFSEANAAKLVVKDMTLPSDISLPASEQLGDGYLGHIFAAPVLKHGDAKNTVQIARLNNDRWAVVMGNGYGSTQGEAALLIQYLDKGKELLVIPAPQRPIDGKQRHNGLSAPRLVDINGDGRPDVVYAGDLTGNLWKFLINTEDEKKWGVAQWSNASGSNPLFSANLGEKHSANVENSTRQAIFAAPAVKANERTKNVGGIEVAVNGVMVAFGTGRNITVNDPIEKQQQTLYSILDNTIYMFERDASNTPTGRVLVCDNLVAAPAVCSNLVKTQDDLPSAVKQSELLERKFAQTTALQRNGADFWTLDQTPVADLDFATHKGWYIQLPEEYERSLKNLDFYDNTTLLMAVTQIPAKGGDQHGDSNVESCDTGGAVAGERQFVNFIDIQDGNPPHFKLIDGSTDTMPLLRAEIPPGSLLPIVISETKVSFQAEASQSGLGLGTRPAAQVVRPNWRQLN